MSNWAAGKRWSDRFLPEIKRILGENLIGEPPIEEDQKRNTDLILLSMTPVRIACRVRRFNYLNQYGDEFTMRSSLPTGGKTEITKVMEGFGDYFFYGFCDELETHLHRWVLADLNVFRKCEDQVKNGQLNHNGDNSSKFVAFNWCDFPDDFIVAAFDKNTSKRKVN